MPCVTRAAVNDVHSVRLPQRKQSMSNADRLFDLWVQLHRIAGVNRNCHTGVGHVSINQPHGFAIHSPRRFQPFDGFRLRRIPAGQLSELKRKIIADMTARLFMPGRTVVTDQLCQLAAIVNRLRNVPGIPFALLPDHAADAVRSDRVNHRVENVSRILMLQRRGLRNERRLQRLEGVFMVTPALIFSL